MGFRVPSRCNLSFCTCSCIKTSRVNLRDGRTTPRMWTPCRCSITDIRKMCIVYVVILVRIKLCVHTHCRRRPDERINAGRRTCPPGCTARNINYPIVDKIRRQCLSTTCFVLLKFPMPMWVGSRDDTNFLPFRTRTFSFYCKLLSRWFFQN